MFLHDLDTLKPIHNRAVKGGALKTYLTIFGLRNHPQDVVLTEEFHLTSEAMTLHN